MHTDRDLNRFAKSSFRDIADGDYIAARLAYRCQLPEQFLWASQQAIEKYLKCILLLHRIPAKDMRHDLCKGLRAITDSDRLTLGLTRKTEKFIDYLDRYARFRYLEIPNSVNDLDLVRLDRAVWELRRFCTLDPEPRVAALVEGRPAPKVRLPLGRLETIIGKDKHPAREALLWQNGFFGDRVRKTVKLSPWIARNNSPLSVEPRLLDEVLKYVYLPKDIVEAYRAHASSQG